MNFVTPLIAWRYIRGSGNDSTISLMIKVCFLGIFIGSFALCLVLFIMRGFEKETHAKLQGIHAQIVVRAYGDALNPTALSRVFEQEFPHIAAWSPTSSGQLLVKSDDSTDCTNVMTFMAIDPEREPDVTSITTIIAQPNTHQLSAMVRGSQVLIGKKCAELLELSIGQSFAVAYPDTASQGNKITFYEHQVTVAGIFSTGIDEFDSNLIIGSYDLHTTLLPDAGITQINIKLKPDANEKEVIEKLQKRLGLEVYSWKDLYPALVSALKLEKYVMFLILALITLVASMSMVSLLFMQIMQKRADIAILRAMGMGTNDIRSIFVLIGGIIGLLGSFLGVAAAIFVACLMEWYPIITLPDAYYVSHIPVALEWHLAALVFCVVLGLSLIATWIPAQKTRSISLAQVLRFEA